MKKLILGLFLVLIWHAAADSVVACTCLPAPGCIEGDAKQCAEGQFKRAGTVFYGKVIDRDKKEPEPKTVQVEKPTSSDTENVIVDVRPQTWQQLGLPGYEYIATVEVEIGWKGFRSRRVFVRATMADGVNCGVNLQIGQSYLFFTWPEKNTFVASGCNTAGADTVALLRKGHRLNQDKK
jgi:hypothetical protein